MHMNISVSMVEKHIMSAIIALRSVDLQRAPGENANVERQ
jgi:hypothetical protein